MSHEAAKKRAEPYTKIVEGLPEMRRDTVDLVKKAVGENRWAYVLVNRSEGHTPLTIHGLRTISTARTYERWLFQCLTLSEPEIKHISPAGQWSPPHLAMTDCWCVE